MTTMKTKQPDKLSDQLRQIVLDCGKSRYQIAKETGIDESALSRFVNGERGLSMEALDKVAECLGLRFTAGSKPRAKKGR